MTDARTSPAEKAQGRAYQVRAPRVSDAIGRALGEVYAREANLPAEMAALLRRLH